jgi:catechol 2,3-dioxygenase-like lactoylglutathione lyase family enzyme
MKLEVVVVPVSNVDRAKQFYKALGWREDADFVADENFRIVQLTPPGSGGSIQFGVGLTSAPPGSLRGLYLVVDDIAAARAELAARGAEVSEIFHEARLGARFRPVGDAERVPGPDIERQTYSSFLSFDDPDGNGWIVQEITTRLPGRE